MRPRDRQAHRSRPSLSKTQLVGLDTSTMADRASETAAGCVSSHMWTVISSASPLVRSRSGSWDERPWCWRHLAAIVRRLSTLVRRPRGGKHPSFHAASFLGCTTGVSKLSSMPGQGLTPLPVGSVQDLVLA